MRRAVRSWSLGLLPGLLLLGFAGAAIAQSGGAWLGVVTQSVTEELRDALELRGDGVLVNRVVEGSPADRAGIRTGDVIVSVNGRSIESPDELADVVRRQEPGANATVRVARRSGNQTLSVRLGARPGSDEDRAPRRSDDDDEEKGEDEDRWEAPTPTPPTPPAAPSEPRVRVFKNGREVEPDDDDFPELRNIPGVPGVPGTPNWTSWNRPRLGVRLQEMNSDLGSYFGGTNGRGALVVEVVDESAAERAGIRAGDVIIAVEGRSVDNADELSKAIADEEGTVSLTLVRKGVRRTIEADLGDTPRRSSTWRSRDGRAPRAPRATPAPRRFESEDEDSRREIEELREEIRELKRQLEEKDR